MFEILSNLEPIRYDTATVLFDELDEFNQVIFLQKQSMFKVGFRLNKAPIYKIKLKQHEIGAYGVSF